jgi:hypothetical protein
MSEGAWGEGKESERFISALERENACWVYDERVRVEAIEK